jgi:hypothetical protein
MTVTVTIRREILDLELRGSESDGVALQRRLPRVCADALTPALESAFGPFDAGDEHLRVERLMIEVADVSLDTLEDELADAVRMQVAEYFRRSWPAPSDGSEIPGVGDVSRRTPAETVDEALLTFLRTGRLPWSFAVPSGERLERLVLDAWGAVAAERGPPPATRAGLLETLALPRTRARLVMQFSPSFVAVVLRGLSAELAATVEEVLVALGQPATRSIAEPSIAGQGFVRRLWNAALGEAAAGRVLGATELVRVAWRGLAAADCADGAFGAVVEARWPGVTTQTKPPRASRDGAEVRRPDAPSSSPDEIVEDPGGVLVDNAGVVLLHPFLPRFFERLGLSTADEFVERERALCLIHHLATGELIAPEYQLTVAKVLCGVPLDEPVEADLGRTEVETDEATVLLDAAIGHWEALRGTSPDALRGEFLTRPGTLAVDADGDWLLRMEGRTVDILLDRLPWGLSLVKLPWMDRLLRVEWR